MESTPDSSDFRIKQAHRTGADGRVTCAEGHKMVTISRRRRSHARSSVTNRIAGTGMPKVMKWSPCLVEHARSTDTSGVTTRPAGPAPGSDAIVGYRAFVAVVV